MPNPDPTLSWAGLLARCTEFARQAVALPTTGDLGRFREAVPAMITLHAVTHALGDLELVDADEVPLALDRAEILISEAGEAILRIWGGHPIPAGVKALLTDAAEALEARLPPAWVLEWVVAAEEVRVGHPGDLAAGLAAAGVVADLYLPTPGIPLFAGSVAATLIAPGPGLPDGRVIAAIAALLGDGVEGPFEVDRPRQVYRQFDFGQGGPVRDVVVELDAAGVPGQPLLVAALLAGEVQPVPMPPRSAVRLEPLPVVDETTFGDAG